MATKIEAPAGQEKEDSDNARKPTTQVVLSIVEGNMEVNVLGEPLTVPMMYRLAYTFFIDTQRRFEDMLVRRVMETQQELEELKGLLSEEGGEETEDESVPVQPSG